MNFKNIFINVCAITVAVFAVILLTGSFRDSKTALGSVSQGSDYHSTSTTAAFTSPIILSTTGGALGSVTITTVGTGSLTLYDGTTTIAANRTNQATSTLANFAVTTGAGTYTFDAVFYTGLIAQFTGANVASTTITWR